jgi:hypothetical protein
MQSQERVPRWLVFCALEPQTRRRDDLPYEHEPDDVDTPDVTRLVELGLLEESLRGSSDALARSARVHRIDAESGTFPVPHADLVRELAGPLGSVTLEQEVLVEHEAKMFAEYVLTARSELGTWRARFKSDGDYYNLHAVLGFLNSLAVELGSDMRWICVRLFADQTACLTAGPEHALRTAVEERALIPEAFTPPSRAVQALRALILQKARA